MSRTKDDRALMKKEQRVLDGIAAAYWFVEQGQKKLRRLRGEFPRMTAADLGMEAPKHEQQ